MNEGGLSSYEGHKSSELHSKSTTPYLPLFLVLCRECDVGIVVTAIGSPWVAIFILSSDICHLGGGCMDVYSSMLVSFGNCCVVCVILWPEIHSHHHKVVGATACFHLPPCGWPYVFRLVCVSTFPY